MSMVNAGLYREVARVIDEIDGQIRTFNDQKKDYYADIKEKMEPADFKALKEAIKLRRKRAADQDACEAHDERVWAILSVLEAPEDRRPEKTAVDPVSASANGIVEETAPTRAHAHVAHEGIPHDPQTGELVDLPGPLPECLRRVA